MATAFVAIVKSKYWGDYLLHIRHVFDTYEKASQWKQDYENEVRKSYGLIVHPPKSGEEEVLDAYLEKKKKVEIASKFICCEIHEFEIE
jgi:hypothetical protein